MRNRIARVVSRQNGDAHDRCREHGRTTARGEHAVMLVPGFGRNLLSSSAALANGVETTISAFPAPKAKGENFQLRSDHNLYFLDAIIPELPSEYVNVEETSNESRNETFIENLPIKLNAFDHDNNYGNDDTFLDLESKYMSLSTQEEMPTAGAQPDTADSQSGATTSNVDEESNSDIDSRPSDVEKASKLHAS